VVFDFVVEAESLRFGCVRRMSLFGDLALELADALTVLHAQGRELRVQRVEVLLHLRDLSRPEVLLLDLPDGRVRGRALPALDDLE
jgi:hypothetical protein